MEFARMVKRRLRRLIGGTAPLAEGQLRLARCEVVEQV